MSRNKLQLDYSISMTTREPRAKETNGVDYYFVSEKEFKENIAKGNFLEWAEFVGHFYGTPKDKVEELRNKGKNVFLEIEVNGAAEVMKKVTDDRVISFFLMPPNIQALESRIRRRKTESEEVIQARLNKGKSEMTKADQYDHVILNDDVARASREIVDLINRKLKS